MAIGIGIGLPFRRNIVTAPAVPTGLSASFTVNTISGDLTWTDNTGGVAQYEIYSSYNGNSYVYLGTTTAGATSYSDTTCKQNASVIYKIRAKKGLLYSDYIISTAISTPLCWKTNQSTRTNVVINTLNIAAGKTVNVDWGDGVNANYTGNNVDITHTYEASAVNVFNIKLSGDLNSITSLSHAAQIKSYGDISNYVISTISGLTFFNFRDTEVSGDISNYIIPSTVTAFYLYNTKVSGALPNKYASNTLTVYRLYNTYMSSTNITIFSKALTEFNIKNQNVVFPTTEIDKLLKALADWYQVNTPTANCTYDLSGTNMGIPTGGINNVDIVRLSGYYTAAGKSATILVRTS